MWKRANKLKLATAALIAVAVVLLACGCTKAEADDPNVEIIENILALQFNGPDDEMLAALWNPANKKIVDGVEVNEAFDRYVEETYGPYFTESELDIFMRVFGTHFQSLADIYGFELQLEGMEIERSEQVDNRYLFKAKVAYQKKGGKKQFAEIEGVALFSTEEKGKIGKFTYTSDQGLSEKLREQ